MPDFKKLFMVLALGTLVFTLAACPEDEDPTTIHFYNSEGWDEVYATAEDGDGEDLLGEFPGTEAEADADHDDWYYVDVPVEDVLRNNVTIVFNDGDEAEAEGTTVDHPDYYYVTMEADENFGTRPDAEFSMREVEDTTVYWYNSEGWEDIRAYAFGAGNGDEYLGGWRGEEVSEAEEDDWYYIDVPADVDADEHFEIIFNGMDEDDEEQQHPEYGEGGVLIEDRDHVYVTIADPGEETASDSKELALANLEEFLATTDVYFYNVDGWDDVYVDAWDADDEELLSNEAAEEADEDYWFTVEIPKGLDEDDEFDVQFHDADENESARFTIDDDEEVYMTLDYVHDDMGEAELQAENIAYVYFYNSEEWDNVYADATNEDLDETDLEAAAVEDNDNWYEVEVPKYVGGDDYFDITFHDGDGNEAEPATIADNVVLYVTMDDLFAGMEQAEIFMDAEEEDFHTFYFYNYHEWQELYVYIFDYDGIEDGEAVGSWPGVRVDDYEEHEGWYQVDLPIDVDENSANLIFNDYLDTGEQIGDDLVVDDSNDIWLTPIEEAFDNREDAEEAVKQAMAGTEVFFYNSEGWDDVYATAEGEDLDEDFTDVAAEEIDADFDGWYSVEVPLFLDGEVYFDIHFHDGDEAESQQFTFDADELHYVTMEERYADLNEATVWTDAEEEDLTRIYFYNSEGWDVHTWTWMHIHPDTDDEIFVPFFESTGWPGVPAEEHEEDDWYYIDLPVDLTEDVELEIIFNNDDDPLTGDFEIPDEDHVYTTYDGEVFTSMEAAEDYVAE